MDATIKARVQKRLSIDKWSITIFNAKAYDIGTTEYKTENLPDFILDRIAMLALLDDKEKIDGVGHVYKTQKHTPSYYIELSERELNQLKEQQHDYI